MVEPAQVARLRLIVEKAQPMRRFGREHDASGSIDSAEDDAELLRAPAKGRHRQVGIVVDEEPLEPLGDRPDGRVVKSQSAGAGVELDDGFAEDRAAQGRIGAARARP